MAVTTIVLIGVNLSVLLFFYIVFKKRIDKVLSTEDIIKTVREEIDQMIVELNQTTNRNIGLVEESINRLTEVLRKADKSIVMLSRETEKQKKSDEAYTNLKPKTIPVPEQKPPENKQKTIQEKVMELYNKGLSPGIISNRLDISVGEIDLIISIHGRK